MKSERKTLKVSAICKLIIVAYRGNRLNLSTFHYKKNICPGLAVDLA
jgi:hypothetical protein